MSIWNSMLKWVEHEKSFITSGPVLPSSSLLTCMKAPIGLKNIGMHVYFFWTKKKIFCLFLINISLKSYMKSN